jgi:plasmid maintenance system antidote protein VapI
VRKELRQELKVELYARGIKIKTVAEYLGLTRTQVSRILNGHNDTTSDNWEKIAKLVKKKFVLEDE